MPIFDQGYQHWQGTISPFHWRWLAIAQRGVRALLKSKIIKGALLAAWMPAILLVVVLAVWGLVEQRAATVLSFMSQFGLPAEMLANPKEFRSPVWTIAFRYFFKAEVIGAIFLVLSVGPGLISRDLRFNALPLYFSRPIRRVDYFLGKLGVIGFFIAATTILPATVAYLVGLAFSLDLSIIRDTHRLLWGSILYGLVITISAGTLMLALSSLSRRSIYVGIAWAGFCFLTLSISGFLFAIHFHSYERNIIHSEMEQWLEKNPPPTGVEMQGIYPARRHRMGDPENPAENQKQIDEWVSEWRTAIRKSRHQGEEVAAGHVLDGGQWRAIVGYTTNLERIGDAILDYDQAWVSIGKTIDKQRPSMLPALAIHSGGKVPKEFMQPTERALADLMAWQFPWQWSAYVLGGLWLLSIFILSRRIKSLDRLK